MAKHSIAESMASLGFEEGDFTDYYLRDAIDYSIQVRECDKAESCRLCESKDKKRGLCPAEAMMTYLAHSAITGAVAANLDGRTDLRKIYILRSNGCTYYFKTTAGRDEYFRSQDYEEDIMVSPDRFKKISFEEDKWEDEQ